MIKAKKQAKLPAFLLFSDPNRIRTYDLQIRNLLLYPAELWDHVFYGANMQKSVLNLNSHKNPALSPWLFRFLI